MARGIIALDIDGTITVDPFVMPERVSKYLGNLAHLGWNIIFITGRSFAWGYMPLQHLDFPYYLAVQNGAILLKMPDRAIVAKKYLNSSIFRPMDAICKDQPYDYVIYAGYEYQDQCYYRPHRFSKELLSYVENRANNLKEKWIPLISYDRLPIKEFASVKCFCDRATAPQLSTKIENLGFHAPIIQDPLDIKMQVIQVTDSAVNKGQALIDLANLMNVRSPIIAAGDGYNDLSMLKYADVKVVMQNSPKELLDYGDIIAPSAEEQGIIEGLEKAILYIQNDRKR